VSIIVIHVILAPTCRPPLIQDKDVRIQGYKTRMYGYEDTRVQRYKVRIHGYRDTRQGCKDTRIRGYRDTRIQ
jgi:hypothetical protein